MADRPDRRFRYQRRTPDQYRKRAEQSGGIYDKWVKDDFERFAAAKGENEIRVLPPTWPEPEHYGLDIFLHYGVGPDNQVYLCPVKMGKGDSCPVCEAYAPLAEHAVELERQGKKMEAKEARENARKLKASKRVLMWVINRKEPEKGPLLYDMPWTLDKKFTDRMIDRRTGELLEVDNPDEGYDLFFKKEGDGIGTEYIGETIARNPSPLSDNSKRAAKWLDFVTENPVPDCLQFFDYEHIAKAFNAAGADADEDDEDAAPKGRHSRPADDEDERPARRPSGSKGSKEIDDEDEDLDDTPAERPSAHKARDEGKPRPRRTDDEDDDAPAPKRASRASLDEDDEDSPPPSRKGSRAPDDDEDDDARRSKEEESDEDDPPPKKKGKRPAADEDDIPFGDADGDD